MKIRKSRKWLSLMFLKLKTSSVLSKLPEIISTWIKMKIIMALILEIKDVWFNKIGKILSLKKLNGIIASEMI